MGAFTQQNRPMAITSPLGVDKLLLMSINGQEGLSMLFNFQASVVAEVKTDVAFDQLLGQPITLRVNDGAKPRFFNGLCNRVAQGDSDSVFTTYVLDVVPKLWFLSKRAQSRMFQQKTVPQILQAVLHGRDVAFELKGKYEPRDYCVQYRETDLNFACRIMEEEGIFYFFKHGDGSHKMVVADTPESHTALPNGSDIKFHRFAGTSDSDTAIRTWFKRQEVRSGVFTLRDHCFELPGKTLEASKKIQDSVQAGQVTHKLTAGDNAKLELYDWPGEYAQRFDGVDKGGGDQPAEIEKINLDNKRTVDIRMVQETTPAVVIQGTADCPRLSAGHQFSLSLVAGDETAKSLKAAGKYVLTSVTHLASQSDFRSGQGGLFQYQNSFTAIPLGLPYRPPRDTPKPFVQGPHTAVVVGPAGSEIFTDKFGRVKVQFHWDREGKSDASSSCWVRVAQLWAGKRWGSSFWPRIGQEVIVAFQEGDPDQPIIIGSVYNAEQMPPYLGDGPDPKHPKDNKVAGVKSNTTPGGEGFNEWRFDDTKDKQQIFLHAERDFDLRIKNESRERVISNSHVIVGNEKDGKKAGDLRRKVFQDEHATVERNRVENVKGNVQLLVGGGEGDNGNVDFVAKKDVKELVEGARHVHVKKDDKELVDGAQHVHVKGLRAEKVDGAQSLTVGGNQDEKVGQNHCLEAGQVIHLKGGQTVVIEAGTQLSLKVGGNFVDINSTGVFIVGSMVMINSGGAAGSGPGAQPTAAQDAMDPQDAKPANPTKPDEADDSKTGVKSSK